MTSASQAMEIDLNEMGISAAARGGLKVGAVGGVVLAMASMAIAYGMLAMLHADVAVFGALARFEQLVLDPMAALQLGAMVFPIAGVLLGAGWLATGRGQLGATLGAITPFVVGVAMVVHGSSPVGGLLAMIALPIGHLFVRRVPWLRGLAAITTVAYLGLAALVAQGVAGRELGVVVFSVVAYFGTLGIGLSSANRMLRLARE